MGKHSRVNSKVYNIAVYTCCFGDVKFSLFERQIGY